VNKPFFSEFTDDDEWTTWNKRGDKVLHIEITKISDLFLIAPLSANTLAKIANGLADNLLTCVSRAWDLFSKPFLVAPAMNTQMYKHPITDKQLKELESFGVQIIPAVVKKLM
jgi:phosphopantothenoylcysteine decarboxylase